MASVRQILEALERIAPSYYALPGDKIGLQIGDPGADVKRAQVSLDRSYHAVHSCLAAHVQLLLCHHPIIWQPITSLAYTSEVNGSIRELIRGDINFIAAHTNWDCAHGGVNDALTARLGLEGVSPFGPAAEIEALKLVTFAPAEAVDRILDAAAAAGAGAIGDYRRCGFTSSGEGAFEAGKDSSPAVGKSGQRNRVTEHRVEMEVPASSRAAVDAAVRAVHPYEEPAIDFLVARKLGVPIGRKGRLSKPLSLAEFRARVDRALGTRSMAWEGKEGKIEWVGAVGGAADDEWRSARAAGCDAFVTGEVKQHNAVEGAGQGISILAAGHYATEQPGVEALAAAMSQAVPDVAWGLFVPKPGQAGRPL